MMDKLQKFCVISLTQGGRHADNTVDLQEFMIMPTGAENMEQAIRMCAEVYQFLRIILKQKGLSTAVGDEGGFAPDLSDSESVLEVILEAVKKAGYEPGKDISIAIDAAASELYDEERGVYVFPGEGKMKGEEVNRADVAASFQEAVVDVLSSHGVEAAKELGYKKLAIAGGVASNGAFRAKMIERCKEAGIEFYHPSPIFCTDNAAMIGVAAYYEYINGTRHGWDLNAVPNLKLGER